MPSILLRPWPAGETGPEDGPGIVIAAAPLSTEVWGPHGAAAAIDGAAVVAIGRITAADALAQSGTVAVDAVAVDMPAGMAVVEAVVMLTAVAGIVAAVAIMVVAAITVDSASVRPADQPRRRLQ
jgi:hypothetical protein